MKEQADRLFAKVKDSLHVEDIAKRDEERIAKIPITYIAGHDDDNHPLGFPGTQENTQVNR